MESKETNFNNAKGLMEELADETLTGCVGGTAWMLDGQYVYADKKNKPFIMDDGEREYLDQDDLEDLTQDPNGSLRAPSGYTYYYKK